MLAALLLWIYTLAACGLAGWAVRRLVVRLLHTGPVGGFPFALDWLLGLAALHSLGSLLSLAVPLALAGPLLVLLVTILAGIIWLRLERLSITGMLSRLRALPRLPLAIFAGAAMLTFILAIARPLNYDSGLYHAQAIHWIESFPAVPGLANFLTRLGYNSSWFLGQALFSFGFLPETSFHLNTSVLFVVAIYHFSGGLVDLWQGQRTLSAWFRAFLIPLAFFGYYAEISSPGTDASTALVCWIVLVEWLAYAEAPHPRSSLRPAILLAVSIFAVTIKPSAAPLLLASLTWLVGELARRAWRTLLVAGGLAAMIALPWMARTVILSGYPIFPFALFDWFNPDWKVPAEQVRAHVDTIQAWAWLPRRTLAEFQALSLPARLSIWWSEQFDLHRAILTLLAAIPSVGLVASIFPPVRRFFGRYLKTSGLVLITLAGGLLFWFFNAPDFRFGYTFILPALALAASFAALALQAAPLRVDRWLPGLLLALVLAYLFNPLTRAAELRSIPQRLLLPAPYPWLSSQPCRMDGKVYWAPDQGAYDQCWYGPFPCRPSCGDPFSLRGESYAEGFRAK